MSMHDNDNSDIPTAEETWHDAFHDATGKDAREVPQEFEDWKEEQEHEQWKYASSQGWC